MADIFNTNPYQTSTLNPQTGKPYSTTTQNPLTTTTPATATPAQPLPQSTTASPGTTATPIIQSSNTARNIINQANQTLAQGTSDQQAQAQLQAQ